MMGYSGGGDKGCSLCSNSTKTASLCQNQGTVSPTPAVQTSSEGTGRAQITHIRTSSQRESSQKGLEKASVQGGILAGPRWKPNRAEGRDEQGKTTDIEFYKNMEYC